MSLEEAVKEAAFQDRDVFVFRNHGGQAMVLYRKRDGKMELIEGSVDLDARISSMTSKKVSKRSTKVSSKKSKKKTKPVSAFEESR